MSSPSTMSARFPLTPRHRIKKRSDFTRLQATAGKIYAPHFLLVVGPSPTGVSRVGLTVTRKIDPRSVARNRLKRRLRETFRHLRPTLTAPLDIVIVARKGSIDLSSAALKREIRDALASRKLLRPGEL